MRPYAIGAALAIALVTPAFAQDKPVELRFGHWVPPSHPMHPAAEAWAASINKASGGTITIKIFPSQQLGKAFDHYNMARDGIADIAHVNPGYEPGRFPIMGASELPFIFGNAKQGSAALDAWYRKYADKEMKDVKYCLTFAHDPATLHTTKKKVTVPGDIAGMKIRPANATIARWISLLGGSNVQASAPESRDVLEKGVAEGITFPWGSIVLFGIDKVTKYHIDSAFYVTEQTWVLNKAKYDSLSPAQRKVFDDHCTSEWAQKIAEPWADFEAGGRDKIKAQAGHEVYTITPDQLAQWRKAAEPLYNEWADAVKKAGHDPKAIYDDLKATVAKYNSGY
ncbi:MAG: TRAP transporter substrate-binding protein [Pseudorhodoplanes sp.]|nr:TRAP transporter substrate-binding protein [Pseudorhodoplanes sp.]